VLCFDSHAAGSPPVAHGRDINIRAVPGILNYCDADGDRDDEIWGRNVAMAAVTFSRKIVLDIR
jgi:hypothetical protein